MAKEPVNTVNDDDEWEEKSAGIGEEWDFDRNGDLIGFFHGTRDIDLPEHSQRPGPDGEMRTKAKVWEYRIEDTGELVFLWDSYQLAELMTEPGHGDKVKIRFNGYREIDGGKRRVKQYKLWTKKS